MAKNIFKFEEKQHILCVDGNDYEIPQRTPRIAELLEKHDKNLKNMTEYEANMNLLSILFGEDNANKMFPDKDSTNLDKLSECAKYALALYMAEHNRLAEKEAKKKLAELSPYVDVFKQVSKAKDTLEAKTTESSDNVSDMK